jgi:outer membrane protein TolC
VSATLVSGDMLKLDFEKDRSLKDNLAVVVRPNRIDSEVAELRRLHDTRRLHLALSKEVFDHVDGLQAKIQETATAVGIEIIPVPVSTDWRSAMAQLGDGVDGVYFLDLPRLSRSERAAFVAALNERRIPAMSGVGPDDIEIGMVATYRRDMTVALVRRTSLNLFQLISGSTTDELPVLLLSDPQLKINGRTAADIGYSLSFEASVLGTILHPEALEASADSLDMLDVLQQSDSGNVALSISNQEVQTALRTKQVVRSPLFPQLGARGAYNYMNNPNLVGVILPEGFARLRVQLSQMIFDDELISNFRSANRDYDAAQYQNDADRLDVYLNAEQAYLNYVQARLLYSIALNNLRLTEGNLEIAKMRVEVGHSGRDEVFRWTAELNQQRTLVMDYESLVETQRIELNRILGVDLAKRWRPQPMDEDVTWLSLVRERFGLVLGTQESFDEFADVFVGVALDNSPEMKFLYKNIEAESIQLGQRKRSFIVPKIFADVNYNWNFWQSPDEPALGDDAYSIRVTAALPIFEGSRRIYDVKLRRSLVRELENRLTLAEQFVEQRTRESLRRIQASLPNIGYSRAAADNAQRNFEVVRDKYANGIVTITDLLSAQTSSFQAEQNAAVSLYAFLQDSAEFQRAVSFFPETKSASEIEAFLEQIRARFEAQDSQ